MPAPLLAVRLKPSTYLAVILGLAHFAAIGLLWPLVLPMTVKLTGAVALAVSLVFHLRRFAWLSAAGAVVAFKLSDELICTLETRQGERVACVLLGGSFVAPYLTVLSLKRAGGFLSRSVVILPDAIDAEAFRQLRVLLRWKWKEPD